jgi:hypothetical protein
MYQTKATSLAPYFIRTNNKHIHIMVDEGSVICTSSSKVYFNAIDKAHGEFCFALEYVCVYVDPFNIVLLSSYY